MLIPIFLLLLLTFVITPNSYAEEIPLENGLVLHLDEIQYSRILPHAYYDQAISSIPGVYPESEIIASRRIGYLRKEPAVLYSLVCYKKSNVNEEVTISGTATSQNRAWSFEMTVMEEDFSSTLILVIEKLGNEMAGK